MTSTRRLKLEITGDAGGAARAFDQADNAAGGFEVTMTKVTGGMTKALGAATAVAGGVAVVGKVAWDAIQAGSDLNETISKTEVIFGDAADAVLGYSENTAATIGVSRQAALDAATTFGTFGKAAGLAGADLAEFSTDAVDLAADLASFHNTSVEDAIGAIGAAMRGEAEPIRAYNVLLDDATLKNKALEMKIWDGVGALSQQERVLAANASILEQTTDAQGDAIRTGDNFAGQMKRLHAQLADVQAELGQKLLPVATEFATWLNDEGVPALIAFGGYLEDEVWPALVDVGEAIGTVVEAVWPFVDAFTDHVLPMLETTAALLSGDLKGGLQALKDGLVELATAPADAIQDLGTKTIATKEEIEAFIDRFGLLDEDALNARAVEEFGHSLDDLLAAAADGGIVIDTTVDRLSYASLAATEARESFGAAAAEIAAATSDLAESSSRSIGRVQLSWEEATDAVREYFDELAGRNDATIAFESAVDDMIGAIAESGLTMDVTTEAGRDQINTLEDMQAAIREQVIQTYGLTGSQEDAEQAGRDLINSFAAQALMAGVNEDAVADLVGEMLNVPSDVTTTFNMDTSGAVYSVAQLEAYIISVVNWINALDQAGGSIVSGILGSVAVQGHSAGVDASPINLTTNISLDGQLIGQRIAEWSRVSGGIPVLTREYG